MNDTPRVRYRKHPLTRDFVETEAPVGLTIREVIGCDSDKLFVALDDEEVPAERWATTALAAGSTLHITTRPGNDDMKKLILVAGVIATAVFAPVAGGAIADAFGKAAALGFAPTGGALLGNAAFWTTAIMAGSSLLMQALVVPPVIEP